MLSSTLRFAEMRSSKSASRTQVQRSKAYRITASQPYCVVHNHIQKCTAWSAVLKSLHKSGQPHIHLPPSLQCCSVGTARDLLDQMNTEQMMEMKGVSLPYSIRKTNTAPRKFPSEWGQEHIALCFWKQQDLSFLCLRRSRHLLQRWLCV